MNVYDQAHNLARALKDCDEYKNYIRLKDEVMKVEGLSGMLADFQKKQFEVQAKQMMGEELGPEVMAQIQDLYQIMMKDPKAMEYLQAEMMFTRIVSEVYGILGEVIQLENK